MRAWSREDIQRCGCEVILPGWQAAPMATIYESFVKVAVNSRIEHSSNVCEQTYSRRPEF